MGIAPAGLMAVFDVIVVGLLLVVPQSYVLWMNSSEFGVPILARVWVFALPGLFVFTRLLISRRRAALRTDSTIVLLYSGVVALGFANAMWRTSFPANVISVYGQKIYWAGLAAAFLWAVADRPATYVLNAVRRFYLFAAATGCVYLILQLLFGEHLPHTMVMADGGRAYVADNYYVSLSYLERGIFGMSVPRFTFLYREPRVLGYHLLVGLVLQAGFLAGQTTRAGRIRAAVGLLVLCGGFLLANSLYSYAVAVIAVIYIGIMLGLRSRVARRGRPLSLAIAVVLLAFWPLVAWTGQNTVVTEQVAARFNKSLAAVRSYFEPRAPVLNVVKRFPLGLGFMNLDEARYLGLYSVSSGEASTLVTSFAQNAGLAGLAVLAVVVWRLLGAVQRVAGTAPAALLKTGALLVGMLLVSSAAVTDSITPGAEGVLFIGWLLATDATLRQPAAHGS